MSHAVIPAPVRFEVGGGREFMFRPGTAVGYADPGLAPIARRICSEITRRTGLRLAPRAGHLHLTDDQSWPLPVGRPAGRPEPGAAFYSGQDLRALAAYAEDRFVTVVPEVDTPGARVRADAAAPGAEHRPQPGRVRTAARP